MGCQGEDGFDAPAEGAFHAKRPDDRSSAGVEASFAERAAIRHADADVFHQSRWEGAVGDAARGTEESAAIAVQADSEQPDEEE